MAFLIAEQYYDQWRELRSGPSAIRGGMLAAIKNWTRKDIAPFIAEEGPAGPPAIVVANHGRWVVKCPGFQCTGAQIPSGADPWFFCESCLNSFNQYQLTPLVWPRFDPTPEEIVEALIIRKSEDNKNWYPGETLSDLVRQNKEHAEENHYIPEFIKQGMKHGFPLKWTIPRAEQVVMLKKAGLNIPPDLKEFDPTPNDDYKPTIFNNYGGSDAMDYS